MGPGTTGSVYKPFKNRIFTDYSPMFPLNIITVGFESQTFWVLSLQCRTQVRCIIWGINPLLLRKKLPLYFVWLLLFFLRCLPPTPTEGCLSRGGVLMSMSLPLLPISLWNFYPLLWNCSASSQVLFRGNFSICSCTSVVSMGKGEIMILLYCHFELPVQTTNIFIIIFCLFVCLKQLVFLL